MIATSIRTINDAALVVPLEQGTPEWLAWRQGKIMASHAPAIMHVSPWVTEFSLWQELTGAVEPQPANEYMARGTRLEPLARVALEARIGYDLPAACVTSIARPWQGASLDGLSEDGEVIAELKCPTSPKDYETARMGQVPAKYWPQVQHQLMVSGARFNAFAVLDPADEECKRLALVLVDPDRAYWKRLLAEEERFLELVRNVETPDLTKADAYYREDPAWAELAEKYRYQDELEKSAKALKDAYKALIMGMKAHPKERGGGLIATTYSKQGAVDNDKVIAELQGRLRGVGASDAINLDDFRKPSTEITTLNLEKREEGALW